MSNPLSRIGEFFSSVASAVVPDGASVLGIDPGSAYLKVVQLRRKGGKALLETYGSLALGPYAQVEVGRATRLPNDILCTALKDLLHEAHVTTARAGLAIPFGSSLVTVVEMPALPPKELASAVPIEARRHVPVPIGEVSLDWWVIPREPDTGPEPTQETAPAEEDTKEEAAPVTQKAAEKLGRIEVLIAAIHNDAVVRFRDVAAQGALDPRFFEIELFSTIRALFQNDLLPHAVLDLGASATKLYIVDRGLLRFSHIVSQGAQDLTLALGSALSLSVVEAEKRKRQIGLSAAAGGDTDRAALEGILSAVFSEVAQGVRAFEARFGRPVADVTLTGGGANLIGIDTYAATHFSAAVRRSDPFSRVEVPAFLHDLLTAVGPEFSVALGAALRGLQEGG